MPCSFGPSTLPARRCTSGAGPTKRSCRGHRSGAGDPDPPAAAGRRAGLAGGDRAASRARPGSAGGTVSGGSARGRRGPGGRRPARTVGAGGRRARSRGNVAAAGVRREPGGDAARRGWAEWWKSAPGRARSRRRSGGRYSIGTRPAASRAATSGSPRGITCGIGPTAGRPSSRISPFSAAGIIGRCTRRAIRSSDYPTACSSSGDRMAGRCPMCPAPPVVPADPSGNAPGAERRAGTQASCADGARPVVRGTAGRALGDRRIAASAGEALRRTSSPSARAPTSTARGA